jgi:hypothetical protein
MIALTLVVLVSSAALAADATAHQTIGVNVPVIRVAGVSGDANITVVAPTVAGEAPAPAVSNTTYLRYTTVSATQGTSIDAKISAIPAGSTIRLVAGAPAAGSGKAGSVGLFFGAFNLSTTTDGHLINGITSGFTGNNSLTNDGASLVYTLTITDWTAIRAAVTHPTVTFTMRDGW